MKKELKTLAVIALTFVSFATYAQKERMIGLWGVEKVAVGGQSMTPVAKWFRINPDGTQQAGNGWLQNKEGVWDYDDENSTFTPVDNLDIEDEFGGFSVSFSNENMLWERVEEGMLVTVTLTSIEKLPMAPSDYLEGLWDLVEITENEESILDSFDSEDKHKIHFRWDRVYINFSPEGERLTGYWHIHGHRPDITLLPHQDNGTVEGWRVAVNEKELLMTGISDSNRTIKRKYVRRKTF